MILTCEHGGNLIPRRFSEAFANASQALKTHRGFDLGALPLARELSSQLRVKLFFSTTSRLLIDLNRSLDNESVFSEFSRALDDKTRSAIVERHYRPHRTRIERALSMEKLSPRVHIGIHSFTPVLDGKRRNCEVGILFDPKRESERKFASSFRRHLQTLAPDLRIRFNYPYKGDSDGFTTALRRRFKPSEYLGIELEFRQDYLGKMQKRRTLKTFAAHVALALDSAEADLSLTRASSRTSK